MTVTADLPFDLAPAVRKRPGSPSAKTPGEKGTGFIGLATFAALVGFCLGRLMSREMRR